MCFPGTLLGQKIGIPEGRQFVLELFYLSRCFHAFLLRGGWYGYLFLCAKVARRGGKGGGHYFGGVILFVEVHFFCMGYFHFGRVYYLLGVLHLGFGESILFETGVDPVMLRCYLCMWRDVAACPWSPQLVRRPGAPAHRARAPPRTQVFPPHPFLILPPFSMPGTRAPTSPHIYSNPPNQIFSCDVILLFCTHFFPLLRCLRILSNVFD